MEIFIRAFFAVFFIHVICCGLIHNEISSTTDLLSSKIPIIRADTRLESKDKNCLPVVRPIVNPNSAETDNPNLYRLVELIEYIDTVYGFSERESWKSYQALINAKQYFVVSRDLQRSNIPLSGELKQSRLLSPSWQTGQSNDYLLPAPSYPDMGLVPLPSHMESELSPTLSNEQEILPSDSLSDAATSHLFCLDQNIFLGGHGEIWRAHLIDQSQSREEHLYNKTFILKRMRVQQRHSAIYNCAQREIYYGKLLRNVTHENSHTQHADNSSQHSFARFVEYFVDEKVDSTGSSVGDYWLVFEDEGLSLQALLYKQHRGESAERGPGNILLESSEIWLRIRNDSRLLRALLCQIISRVEALHERQIVHRDIKPSNVLIDLKQALRRRERGAQQVTDEELLIAFNKLKIADFSSAYSFARDEETVQTMKSLYTLTAERDTSAAERDGDGEVVRDRPSILEETLAYAPPEVLLPIRSNALFDGYDASCSDQQDNGYGYQHVDGYGCPAFNLLRPESYDIWSIGVLALEVILGSVNSIFTLDPRTTLEVKRRLRKWRLKSKGEGEREREQREMDWATLEKNALYLAALSEYCIFDR